MSPGAYSIADEPKPGGLAHLVVNPLWPLLGFMLGGTWFGWAWFALNGHALGSATRRREIRLMFGGLIGSAVIIIVGSIIFKSIASESPMMARFVLLALTVWKLTVSYMLYLMQMRSFSIYEYYDGIVRNGLPILIVGAFLGHRVIGVIGSGLLRGMLS